MKKSLFEEQQEQEKTVSWIWTIKKKKGILDMYNLGLKNCAGHKGTSVHN